MVDRFVSQPGDPPDRCSSQRILHVVPPGQRHRRHWLVLVKPDDLAPRARREPAHELIAAVEHGEVLWRGELDRSGLQIHVALERPVALEVVRRDVEDHADVQARLLDRLQLEARELEHDPVLGRDLVHAVEHRVANVAADDHGATTCRQHLARERGGGCLSIGAGDADHRALAELEEEVDLARDRDSSRPRLVQQLGIPRHPGARIDDVDAIENGNVIAAELELDAWRHLRDGRLEVGGRFAIGHANFLTFGGEMQSERDAAAGRAHDEGPHTASFTRATAASAETSPAPQKASAMRFSDQPSWWNV